MAKQLKSAFTLIELLIVVAIIGILAAIAVPNFLHAQIRARVARVQSDSHAIAVALESFRVFEGRLPYVNEYMDGTHYNGLTQFSPANAPLKTLTSPVSHIAALPGDPFRGGDYHYAYMTDVNNCWVNGSYGPDKSRTFFSGASGGYSNESQFVFGPPNASPTTPKGCDGRYFLPPSRGGDQLAQLNGGGQGAGNGIYDPSNGITSRGDIIRTGP